MIRCPKMKLPPYLIWVFFSFLLSNTFKTKKLLKIMIAEKFLSLLVNLFVIKLVKKKTTKSYT